LQYKIFHSTIPPGAHRFQADIKTFHNLEELEFFEIEKFYSLPDFLDKAYSYQLSFNLIRPNSYKENKAPWELKKRILNYLKLFVCYLRLFLTKCFIRRILNEYTMYLRFLIFIFVFK
jgi:hypothetical protein